MKKRKVLGFVVAALLAGFVSSAVAQSATAYSSSAIGVIKKTLPAHKLVSVSVPLDQEADTGDGFPFQSVPAFSNMPNGSVANFWDAENQKWVSQTKTPKSGWGAIKSRPVHVGESFFLKNDGEEAIEIVISGEVPADGSISRSFPAGALESAANPYPVTQLFTNLTCASLLPNGSMVNFWDETNQKWVSQTKTPKSGWGAFKTRTVQAGEGFFIKASNTVTWVEVRPYTWPN